MAKHYITNHIQSIGEMLGSQTLTHFCLYAIAKQTGHEVALSTAPNQFQGVVPECFDIPFSTFPQNTPHQVYNSTLCYAPVVEEELFKLNPNVNYVINARFDYGYVYWKDLLPELKTIFKIKSKFLDEAKSIINRISKPTACLNFRRGVYPVYMDKYMDYYKKALEQIPKDVVLLLFSDDFDWINSSEELKQLVEGREVVRANFINFVQLSLMSLSDYNVCSPSCFSFVGSLLSSNLNQIVMFPYLHQTELMNVFGHFQQWVDGALPTWKQIKF